MFDKVKGLLSGVKNESADDITKVKPKRRSYGKALNVEETLLLASGVDLKTIRWRKNNPVFVKEISSTTMLKRKISKNDLQQPNKGLPDVGQQQMQLGELSNCEKQEASIVSRDVLTEEVLEQLDKTAHKQRRDLPQKKVLSSELSSETNWRSLMKESIDFKTVSSIITLEAERSSQMSSSEKWSSHYFKPEK